MPPRNETVRDRSNYFRRCCKNCAPPRPIPSPDFAILCPFPSANGTCALSRGDVSLFSWCSTRYPVQNPMYAIKMPRTRAAERNMTFRHITLPCNRRTVFMYTRLINAYLFIQRYLTAAAMLSMFVSQMHVS